MAGLTFLNAFYPAKVITLAPTFRQVKYNIWGEIHALHSQAKRQGIPIGGELLDTELKMGEGWYMMGMSTNEPDRIHGIHSRNVLLIIDEAQGIKLPIFDAAENVMAGGNVHLLLLYNPTTLSGEAFDSTHINAALYNCIRIAFKDTPNAKAGQVVIPGMLTQQAVDEWIRKYGIDSNFVRVKVLGLEPKQEDDALVELDWIEQAFNREVEPEGDAHTGVDVGRFGDDDSSMTTIKGRHTYPIKSVHGRDTMEVCGLMIQEMDKYNSDSIVDEIGVGGGVVDRGQEIADEGAEGSVEKKRKPVSGFVVSRKPSNPKKFFDLRSEVWWGIREALDPQNPNAISLHRNLNLQAQLSTVHYKVMSDGRIKIESKDEMKKRTGESPDESDSLGLALVGKRTGTLVAGASTQKPGSSTKGGGFTRLSSRMGMIRRRRA